MGCGNAWRCGSGSADVVAAPIGTAGGLETVLAAHSPGRAPMTLDNKRYVTKYYGELVGEVQFLSVQESGGLWLIFWLMQERLKSGFTGRGAGEDAANSLPSLPCRYALPPQ